MALGCIAMNRWYQPDCRDCDGLRRDAATARMGKDLLRAHHGSVVVKRLALSLKDGASDKAGRLISNRHELRNDLPRLETPRQAEPAGRAEITTHRAADL